MSTAASLLMRGTVRRPSGSGRSSRMPETGINGPPQQAQRLSPEILDGCGA
jgi:hypothetical protein